MNRFNPLPSLATIVVASVLALCAGCAQKADKPTAGQPLGAGNMTTVINKTCQQYGLPFVSSPYTITGSQGPYGEFSVSCGTPQLFSDGIGNVTVANLQMFYALSDSNDGTLAFYANSAGTGSPGATISLIRGTPSEWDTSAGTGTFAMSSNWASLVVTAGTTAGGLSTSSTASNFHLRTSLSQ